MQKEDKEEFFERPFEEVEGGYFDNRGFYIIGNDSFCYEDYNYFNHY